MIPLTLLAGGGWKNLALGLAAALVLFVLLGVAFLRGYSTGYDAADLERRAEVAAIREDHAQALAGAEAIARKRLEDATARANALESDFLAARRTIEKQSRELTNQRIIHASKDVAAVDGACRFGPEWVRLYNEALGTRDRGDAVPDTSPGPDGAAGAPGTAQAGILQGGEAVNPEDILAHVRDVGKYIRELEAQTTALIGWAEGLNVKGVTP